MPIGDVSRLKGPDLSRGQRTPRNDYTNQGQDKTRTTPVKKPSRSKSFSRLPPDNRIPKPEAFQYESPRDAKSLQGRGRPRTRGDERPVLTRPPSATERKGKDPLGQTIDLSEVFNKASKKQVAQPGAKKPFGRSHSLSRMDKVAQQNIPQKRVPVSKKAFTQNGKKIFAQLVKSGSRLIINNQAPPPPPLPQTSLLSDSLVEARSAQTPPTKPIKPSLTIYTPESPRVDNPDMSPGRASIQDKLSLSDSFSPQSRRKDSVEMKVREEDQGGGEARALGADALDDKDNMLSIAETYYYLAEAMEELDDTFNWKELPDLQPHANQITRILNRELQLRGITQVNGEKNWKVKGIADWLVANQVLQDFDGPSLEKLMDRILPELQKAGYFKGRPPSAWAILYTLLSDETALNSITELNFDNLKLSDVMVPGLPVCQGLPLCMRRLELPRVKDVSFKGNHFTAIPEMLYELAPGAEVLSFSNNRFTEVPSDIFRNLRRLKELYLSANLDLKKRSITQIPYNLKIWSESCNRKSIRIILNENQISKVIPDHFPATTTDVVRVKFELKDNTDADGNLTDFSRITESNNTRGMVYQPNKRMHTLNKLTMEW